MKVRDHGKPARLTLALLLAAIALNAFAGGAYGLAGARGVPTAWLAGSPFATYRIPSLVLIIVVGGACLTASIALLARWQAARAAALSSGVVLLAWIVAQVAVIGYVSWLQPAIAVAALVVLALTPRIDG